MTPLINLQFGRGRAEEPAEIVLPTDAPGLLYLAECAVRQSENAAAAGRFAEADRLQVLAITARCRATGARA